MLTEGEQVLVNRTIEWGETASRQRLIKLLGAVLACRGVEPFVPYACTSEECWLAVLGVIRRAIDSKDK